MELARTITINSVALVKVSFLEDFFGAVFYIFITYFIHHGLYFYDL
jgi:hypothetical protein